jgi:hypothetical protein
MRRLIVPLLFACQVFLTGCDLGEPSPPGPQLVKIRLQYNFRDMVDTFNGTLTKDLVLDGTVTVPFWLTKSEQDGLLAEIEREGFFNMPDTIASIPGVVITPDPSPDFLRVQVNGSDKTVVWNYPINTSNPQGQAIRRLATALWNTVTAKPEYKQLPPTRGGYL